jgi:hypothetical protein
MKFLLLCLIFLTNILYANYAITGENAGKIDMHGGKSDMLLNNKNSLSNTNFNNLGNIGINKPVSPTAPQQLIKEEIKKEETKETTK